MINPINIFLNPNIQSQRNRINKSYLANPKEDSIELPKNIINVSKTKNVTRVSFNGKLTNPNIPAIQMRLYNVSRHQKTLNDNNPYQEDDNIDRLSESNWKDEKKLDFKIVKRNDIEEISVIDPDFGEIGTVPNTIANEIINYLKAYKKDFEFTLANVVAGNNKEISTTGIKVNLKYRGRDKRVDYNTNKMFSKLLNSPKDSVRSFVLPYQPITSPDEILRRIFSETNKKYGQEAANDLEKTVETICDEINNPENKKILLVGHTYPDGDTIGCLLGMEAAITNTYPDKQVDCLIDGVIPKLFNESILGIEKIKNNTDTKDYDLVMFMDISSPDSYSSKYKEYADNAKNIIFIDHHLNRNSKWDDKKDKTGIDMSKIQQENMKLILPEIPAASELVAILVNKAGLLNSLVKNVEKSRQFLAAIITGISMDTGIFTRISNISGEDVNKKVEHRPNYAPEGLVKWLIRQQGNNINKKWIRENVIYNLKSSTNIIDNDDFRSHLHNYLNNSTQIYPDLGLGFIGVSYDEINNLYNKAKKIDDTIELTDIKKSIKFSEAFSNLKKGIKVEEDNDSRTISHIYNKWGTNRITVLIFQDEKKGEINEDNKISDCNRLKISIRSLQGTNYAAIIAELFNGGGHSSAAGARLQLEDIGLNTKLAVKIDGEIEKNPQTIYEKLIHNCEIKQSTNPDSILKQKPLYNFEIIKDSNGKNVYDLIADVVTEIREATFK